MGNVKLNISQINALTKIQITMWLRQVECGGIGLIWQEHWANQAD